jgi:drug/metabolite transporter (DMT)-like permease
VDQVAPVAAVERPRPGEPVLSVHLALIAVQVMFASLGVAGKLVLRELPPLALIAFRTPVAALVLLVVSAFSPRERVAPRDLASIFVYALFGIIANQLLFIEGLQRTTATNAVVIGATIPVFTVGVAVALRREQATRAKTIGLLVAFLGAMAIVGAGRFEAGGSRLSGNLLIVANSLCFSIYLVISRGVLERYRTLTVITWTMLFGALGVLPFGAVDLFTHARSLSATSWAGLVWIVLFPSVGTYFLNAYALKRAPSSLVAIYIYVQPVLGALLAAAMLGERPSLFTAIGGALIAGGITLVNRDARRQSAD